MRSSTTSTADMDPRLHPVLSEIGRYSKVLVLWSSAALTGAWLASPVADLRHFQIPQTTWPDRHGSAHREDDGRLRQLMRGLRRECRVGAVGHAIAGTSLGL